MLMNLEEKYDYDDVLMIPVESNIPSRNLVNLEREFTFRWSGLKKTGIGIIAANMDTVGTFSMATELGKHKVFTALHKHNDIEALVNRFRYTDGQDFCFFTIGTGDADFKRLGIMAANQATPDMICIDIANGHSNILLDAIRRVRKLCPNSIIMAGNVVTPLRTAQLITAGADIVKVGIGGGSACTTRRQTGVGYPQLSAVYECAKEAKKWKGMVCADGGCTKPGDIAKAMVAGADFVMLGGMLAGHKQCGGTVIDHKLQLDPAVQAFFDVDGEVKLRYGGLTYGHLGGLPKTAWLPVPLEIPEVLFYGMSSETAMNKHNGGVAKYRSSEGRTVQIKYRGDVKDTILDILGGLRSALSYVGVLDAEWADGATKFVKTNQQLNTVFVK